ncbi:MAG: GMC family oxidoreductase N-terminal domain-containing protein [Gammaproteobacteria bacterium]|nr:GMC family oxidoreductase N-terminal domain-containing protein [Gammaproteobacteria bacterium]
MSEIFDYIIIGSGSAGSVLANRLSEDPSASVCVLEAGPRDLHPFIHIPAGFMKTMVNPSVNWMYQMEPSAGTSGRSIAQPRGKTLGGSSSINGHIYNRGQRMDFNVWAQRGNRGWSYADVLPYFRRSERRVGDGDNDFRGRDGNFVVTDLDWRHPLCEAFIEGAVSMGIPRNPDYNGAQQDGVGYFQRSIYRGRRMSAARAFLKPAKKRKNLSIRTKAFVQRIDFDGKRATGVTLRLGNREQTISARREVILSAGSINSPQLLQLSGVGPSALLNDFGIPIVHGLDGVGENLRDHYAVRMVASARNTDTINERTRGLRLVSEVLKYSMGKPSILGLQPSLVHVFWKSNPHLEQGDLQVTFTPASYKEGVQSQLDTHPGVTVAPWQQRPESTGFVRIQSREPSQAPAIQPNYLAHETDRQVLLGGMRLSRQLLRTKPLEPYFQMEEFPGDQVQGDDELLDFARQRGTTCFHVMGTCRMGPTSDPTAVVDDQLRVHGLEGLRVVDASIMPTMPSANTNASTLMIAEKAADLILGREAPAAAELPD